MKISIIITVYNRTTFLSEAIQSALDQEPVPEVIVVDDGSRHTEAQEIQQIIQQFDRVQLVTQPKNLGVSAARNEGLKYASGDYVIFLDDDDLLSLDFFNRANNYLEQNDVLVFRSKVFAADESSSRFRKVQKLYTYHQDRYSNKGIDNPGYFLIYTPAIHSVIFRKSLFYHFQFSESLDYGEDRLLLMQMRADQLKFKVINEPGGLYRIHESKDYAAEATIFTKLLRVSDLLHTNFEKKFVELLDAYFALKRKKYIRSLRWLSKALTSRGVWSYVFGFFTYRPKSSRE